MDNVFRSTAQQEAAAEPFRRGSLQPTKGAMKNVPRSHPRNIRPAMLVG